MRGLIIMGIGVVLAVPIFSLSIILDYESRIHVMFLAIVFAIVGIGIMVKIYEDSRTEQPKKSLPIRYHKPPQLGITPIGIDYISYEPGQIRIIEPPSPINEWDW